MHKKPKHVEVELKLIPDSYAGRVVIIVFLFGKMVVVIKFFFVLPNHHSAKTGTTFFKTNFITKTFIFRCIIATCISPCIAILKVDCQIKLLFFGSLKHISFEAFNC